MSPMTAMHTYCVLQVCIHDRRCLLDGEVVETEHSTDYLGFVADGTFIIIAYTIR